MAYENDHLARTDCAVIDYGEEPPTQKQIEVMAKIVALLCRELCLPLAEDTVMTHCEMAFVDGYGPGDGDPDMRWDLWFLPEPNTLGGALYPGGLLPGHALGLMVSAGAQHPGRGPVSRRPAAAGQSAVLSGYCGGSIIICCMQ